MQWILVSFDRGHAITDVTAFTPVVLEVTSTHFTVDTGLGAFLFHFVGRPGSIVLGAPPDYHVTHGGYVRELGPVPQALAGVLKESVTITYVVRANTLTLTVGGWGLHFRANGPAMLPYWFEPDS